MAKDWIYKERTGNCRRDKRRKDGREGLGNLKRDLRPAGAPGKTQAQFSTQYLPKLQTPYVCVRESMVLA
jgi:hypothetical protein